MLFVRNMLLNVLVQMGQYGTKMAFASKVGKLAGSVGATTHGTVVSCLRGSERSRWLSAATLLVRELCAREHAVNLVRHGGQMFALVPTSFFLRNTDFLDHRNR